MNNSTYNALSATGAFLLWFTWSYHINLGADNVLLSALFQGVISATLTLIMIRSLTALANKFKTPLSKILYPPLIISISCAFFGFLVHALINTSQIIKTLCPAVVVGFIFCIFTCVKNTISEERENV
jgi:hypothetical protein